MRRRLTSKPYLHHLATVSVLDKPTAVGPNNPDPPCAYLWFADLLLLPGKPSSSSGPVTKRSAGSTSTYVSTRPTEHQHKPATRFTHSTFSEGAHCVHLEIERERIEPASISLGLRRHGYNVIKIHREYLIWVQLVDFCRGRGRFGTLPRLASKLVHLWAHASKAPVQIIGRLGYLNGAASRGKH